MASYYTNMRTLLKIFQFRSFPIQGIHHLASDGKILIATQTISVLCLTKEAKGFQKEHKGRSPHGSNSSLAELA